MRQQPWPCKESGGRPQPASLKRHTNTSKDTVDTDHFIYNLDLMDTSKHPDLLCHYSQKESTQVVFMDERIGEMWRIHTGQ